MVHYDENLQVTPLEDAGVPLNKELERMCEVVSIAQRMLEQKESYYKARIKAMVLKIKEKDESVRSTVEHWQYLFSEVCEEKDKLVYKIKCFNSLPWYKRVFYKFNL